MNTKLKFELIENLVAEGFTQIDNMQHPDYSKYKNMYDTILHLCHVKECENVTVHALPFPEHEEHCTTVDFDYYIHGITMHIFLHPVKLVLPEANNMNTYDIHFKDTNSSNNKGFKESLEYCQQYIKQNNGTNNSYFSDYKGGTVSIVCNETQETIFETEVK